MSGNGNGNGNDVGNGQGMEVGDQPIAIAGDAGDLRLVFKEVLDTASKKHIPAQFLYSNKAHGAEGPA